MFMLKILSRFRFLVFLFLIFACCSNIFEPSEKFYRFTPSATYLVEFNKTRECVRRFGYYDGDKFEDLKFYVVLVEDGFETKYGEAAGAYSNQRIYIAFSYINNLYIVRHEMIHAISQRYDHPQPLFIECVDGVYDPPLELKENDRNDKGTL